MKRIEQKTEVSDLEEDLGMELKYQEMVHPRVARYVMGVDDYLTEEGKKRIWDRIRQSKPELPKEF